MDFEKKSADYNKKHEINYTVGKELSNFFFQCFHRKKRPIIIEKKQIWNLLLLYDCFEKKADA